jgi:hypothetical protein
VYPYVKGKLLSFIGVMEKMLDIISKKI